MLRPRPSLLITHIYNEEYLLPWWVKHHVTMFDKGVVIDYQSTDASLDIIRTLAPHWEIVPSTETEFHGGSCDVQVMDQERRFPDHWKMALNTTEFLCVPDMKLWLAMLEQHGWEAYGIRTAIMADPPGVYPEPPDKDTPLILQRHHGFFETEHLISRQPFFSRCRIIHRMSDGAYSNGRHRSAHRTYIHPPSALLKYCLYSPMSPEFVARKLQIGQRIPVAEQKRYPTSPHLLNESGQYDRYRAEIAKSVDLRQRREYANVLFPWEQRDDLRDTIDRYPAAPGFAFYELATHGAAPVAEAWRVLGRQNANMAYLFGLLHWARTELDKRPFDPVMMQLLGAVAVRMGIGEGPWKADGPWQVRREEFLRILQDMETLVARYPTRPDLWWSLAQLRAAAGQQKEADEARRVARLLYPVLENTPDDTICVPA